MSALQQKGGDSDELVIFLAGIGISSLYLLEVWGMAFL